MTTVTYVAYDSVEKWIEKLMEIRQASHERNEYVRLLLGMVAEKRLSYPFHIPPDPGPLPLPPLPNRLHSKFKNIMGAHESVFWSEIYRQLMPPEAYSYHELELQIEADKVLIKELKDRLAVLEGTCERIASHCQDHRAQDTAQALDLDIEHRHRLKWVEGTMAHYRAYTDLYEKLLGSVRHSTAERDGARRSDTVQEARGTPPILSLNQCPPRVHRPPKASPSSPGGTSTSTANGSFGTHRPIPFSSHHPYSLSAGLAAAPLIEGSNEGSGLDQTSVLEFIYKHKEDQVKEMEEYVVAMEHRHCEAERALREEMNRQKDKYIEYIQNMEEKGRDRDQRYLDAFGTIRRLQDENRSLKDSSASNAVYIDTLLSRIDDLKAVVDAKSSDKESMRHLEDLFVHSLEQICAAGSPVPLTAAGRSSHANGSTIDRSKRGAERVSADRGMGRDRDGAATGAGAGGDSSGGRYRVYTKPRVPTRAERLLEKKKKDMRGQGQGQGERQEAYLSRSSHAAVRGRDNGRNWTDKRGSQRATRSLSPTGVSGRGAAYGNGACAPILSPSAARPITTSYPHPPLLAAPAMSMVGTSGDGSSNSKGDGTDSNPVRKLRASLGIHSLNHPVIEAPQPLRKGSDKNVRVGGIYIERMNEITHASVESEKQNTLHMEVHP